LKELFIYLGIIIIKSEFDFGVIVALLLQDHRTMLPYLLRINAATQTIMHQNYTPA